MYPHEHGYTGNDPVGGRERHEWVERFRQLPQMPALLAQAFLRPMVDRGRGGMILLASLSSFQATPYCVPVQTTDVP